MALVNDVYTTTKTFPKDEVWGLNAHEMKSRIIGLMAAIRKFAAALRK